MHQPPLTKRESTAPKQCSVHLENVLPLDQHVNFVWTIMIIKHQMIGFLAMHYFFVHALNAQIISKLFSSYALIIIE